MPKQKTHSGAKKRFKVSKSGKVKIRKSKQRSLLDRKITSKKEKIEKRCISFWQTSKNHQEHGSRLMGGKHNEN